MENQIMDNKIDSAINNILTAYLAQMESALQISSILSEHSEDKILSGDHIIGGLVYRLMIPMSDNEMIESLQVANNIMNQSESDSDSELPDDRNIIDNSLEINEPKKIKINNCNCEICSKVKGCIENYHSYQPIDELAFKFKNSICDTCKKHNIII